MKRLAKYLLSRTPYRVLRATDVNRFDAIEGCLRSLRDRGYQPRIVIDGGAHVGSFSLSASRTFPGAAFHLIEPQPACFGKLEELALSRKFHLHKCALSDQAGETFLSASQTPSTGAHVTTDTSGASVRVVANTLDGLFASSIDPRDRALLKLDLQGYELHALKGGTRCLAAVEVLLTEVSFFAQAYEPPIVNLMTFLDKQGFVLHDIAAVAARRRDNRARQGDFLFVRKDSELAADCRWA